MLKRKENKVGSMNWKVRPELNTEGAVIGKLAHRAANLVPLGAVLASDTRLADSVV